MRPSLRASLEDPQRRSTVLSAGLAGAGASSAGSVLLDWASARAKKLASLELMNRFRQEAEVAEGPQKVSLMALFSFATTRERWLMLAGLVSAGVAGLAMPVWLLLLAQSLETFNNLGIIISAGGDTSILMDEMNKLIISFAIVGAVSLFSGSI